MWAVKARGEQPYRVEESYAPAATLLTTGRGVADAHQVLWLPWIALDRRIRALLAERMERGAADKLDRLLAALIAERDAVERAGWFS